MSTRKARNHIRPKFTTFSAFGRRVSRGFAHGFAQMSSVVVIGTVGASTPHLRSRSSEDAFREDWAKVGGDMKRAIRKTRALEEA